MEDTESRAGPERKSTVYRDKKATWYSAAILLEDGHDARAQLSRAMDGWRHSWSPERTPKGMLVGQLPYVYELSSWPHGSDLCMTQNS